VIELTENALELHGKMEGEECGGFVTMAARRAINSDEAHRVQGWDMTG
jgi:hypothetical protein